MSGDVLAKRLLVVDDHEIIRLGLRLMLQGLDLQIVGEATNATEAIEAVQNLQPNVVLMDIRMEGGDGLNTLGRMKLDNPDLPIVLYSAYDNPTYIARAVALGASGYVLKSAPRERLHEALLTAAAGESAWTREELRRVTGALATPRLSQDIEVPLTQRESEVLRQMALGLTNKEIAKMLGISYETVKEHVQHILRKIGVSDRTQAAVWAVRKNLV
ncbi:MAG: response regulator transcription factor [Planctomycetota bacterium]|nr:response regulator transcription factor [Planctomycetota bacterium]MEC7680130.1 response regulator transcription factor [Planctomycetota bacterium]